MDFDVYQELASRTRADHESRDLAIAILTLGLTGEAGEAAEEIKHYLGHGHDLDMQKFKKELGDVLWYLSQLAHMFNINLSEIAELNIAKLRARYPEGFSVQHSKARLDENAGL
jgi:NTP pyrophosphatase (non-canonical NTP hydrolase)